jgi:beta-glucanase (GH16 family)
LNTRGHFEQRYGRMEARIMLPKGQGIWPAFWMVGSNIGEVGWPACGETDIMEFVGRTPNTVYATLNGPGYTAGKAIQRRIECDTLSTKFHTYGLEWNPNKMVWTFDGKPYHVVEPKDVAPHDWPFDKPQFLLLTLAVGGTFPGRPDAATVFPQRLVVAWVKVWKDTNLTP